MLASVDVKNVMGNQTEVKNLEVMNFLVKNFYDRVQVEILVPDQKIRGDFTENPTYSGANLKPVPEPVEKVKGIQMPVRASRVLPDASIDFQVEVDSKNFSDA